MTVEPWSGAVLTGGASRRMGVDKALLEVDGTPMALRVARALVAAGADGVCCVGGDGERLRALGLGFVADLHPGEGPLGALLTALSESPHPIVVVAPCDLLAPDPKVATALVGALRAAPHAGAAVAVVGGVRQPLDGAYRRSALDALAAAFARGERSVKRAIDAIPVLELATVPPEAVHDADTPEDLATER